MPKLDMTIPAEAEMEYMGRNGIGKIAGLNVFPIENDYRGNDGGFLLLEPINSKGFHGRCSLEIPIGQVEEFISLLETGVAMIRRRRLIL